MNDHLRAALVFAAFLVAILGHLAVVALAWMWLGAWAIPVAVAPVGVCIWAIASERRE